MEERPLAMAFVPVQQWGGLWEDREAFERGTIFRDLNLPFYAAEELRLPGKDQEKTEREKLLLDICRISFVLDDLTLYLDTHEDDRGALDLYREKSGEKEKLMKQFAEQYYPLTRDCVSSCGREEAGFCWQIGPLPWEGECGHVAL